MRIARLIAVPFLVAAVAIGLKALMTPSLGDLEVVDLEGKTFVITGATSGLGQWQAEVLASWGARLVLPVRDPRKAKAFVDHISKTYPKTPPPVVMSMDLNSLESVRGFADAYTGPVNVLVNNAAILGSAKLRRTIDGFEECLQVNYLSHFLLTALLLDRIENSPSGRIIHVAAEAYEWANISISSMVADKVLGPDFSFRQNFLGNLGGSYADSKLAQMLFSSALNRRLKNNAVSISLHPAITQTGLLRDEKPGAVMKLFYDYVFFPVATAVGFAQSKQDAPKTQIHASTHPALQRGGGRYYSPLHPPLVGCGKPAEDCAVSEVKPVVRNMSLQEELFVASCKVLGLSGGMCARTV